MINERQPKEAGYTFTLSKEQDDAIIAKIKQARDDLQALRDRRKPGLDAYARKPFQEQEGRSNYQSADVFVQVEGTFPTLVGQARNEDNQVRVKGPNLKVAKALLVKCRETIAANNDFLIWACLAKDGLLSVVGTVKMYWARSYRKTVDERSGISMQDAQILQALYDAGEIQGLEIEEEPPVFVATADAGGVPVYEQSPPTYKARVTLMELEKSEAVVSPVPPEQVIFERGKAHINDTRGCGHQVTITVGELLSMQEKFSTPEEPFFDPAALERAIAQATKDESSGQTDERVGREELAFSGGGERRDFNLTSSKLHRPITFLEWSDNVIHEERLVPTLLWYASDINLRTQHNEDGFVNMSCWSPYFIPHSVVGMGVAEQHISNQDAKSQLGRGLLEHVARLIDEETFVLNPGTDIVGLKNRRAGGMTYAEPGKDFVRGTVLPLKADLITAFEFVKTEIHDQGPTRRWTMGANVDPRNTTATGQALMSQAAGLQQNMILLLFVECMVDIYSKVLRLIQRNCEVLEVEVEGEKIRLTNEQIQGPYTVYSQAGKSFDPNSSGMLRATMLTQKIEALAAVAPNMVSPQNVYNAEKRWLQEIGESNVADYISPPAQPAPGPVLPGLPPGQGGMTAPDRAMGMGGGEDLKPVGVG